MHLSAASLGATLTPGDIAIERASGMQRKGSTDTMKRAATVDLDDILGGAPHQSLDQRRMACHCSPRSGLRNPRGLGSDWPLQTTDRSRPTRSLTDCGLNVSAHSLAAIVARGAPLDGAKNVRLSLLTARMAKPNPIGLA